jgi:histone H4
MGGVGGLDPQVAGDVGSSISVVEGSLGSVDPSQAAVSSSVQPAPSRFTKQKSVSRLIVNPGPLTDSASKSPDLGSSAGPLVSPVPGSDRPRTGGKSVGGKRLANLTTLRIVQPSSDDEGENEDEEAADVPCSSTSTKVATSTTEKTKVAPVITKQKGKDKATQPGGSKRHGKKIAKPVLDGITKNDIGRVAKRAGVTRVGGGVYDEMRVQAQGYLDDLLTKTLIHTEYRKAQTVTTGDVLQGFKSVGGGTFYD